MAQGKRKMIRQVYHVKRDGRKDKSSDAIPREEKPIRALKNLAISGKKLKQPSVDILDAKSEPKKLKASKSKLQLPIPKTKAQPRGPLGFSNWQIKKLQKLSAEELKEKGMVWVHKRNFQECDNNDGHIMGLKRIVEKKRTKKQLRYVSDHKDY